MLSHAGGAHVDVLVWNKEMDEQGYRIAVGHHGSSLLAGSKVEPAVQITRDGKPVADAKVFNALLDADGKTVLAEEVATVYEPPTTTSRRTMLRVRSRSHPAHGKPMLRYRIALAGRKGRAHVRCASGRKISIALVMRREPPTKKMARDARPEHHPVPHRENLGKLPHPQAQRPSRLESYDRFGVA